MYKHLLLSLLAHYVWEHYKNLLWQWLFLFSLEHDVQQWSTSVGMLQWSDPIEVLHRVDTDLVIICCQVLAVIANDQDRSHLEKLQPPPGEQVTT